MFFDPDALYLNDPRYDSATAVYQYYAGNGDLLYVGQTNDLHIRDLAHCKGSWWRAGAAYAFCEVYPTTALASLVEARQINELAPLHNVKTYYVPDDIPPRHHWFIDKMGGELKAHDSFWLAVETQWPWTPPKRLATPPDISKTHRERLDGAERGM